MPEQPKNRERKTRARQAVRPQAGLRHHRWNSPAFGGILGGLIMEGAKIKDLSQITVAFIVLGETFGAVMVGTPA